VTSPKHPGLDAIVRNLEKAKSIVLFTHQDPDDDAVGSTMALREVLLRQGKQVTNVYVLQHPKIQPPQGKGIQVFKRPTEEKVTFDLNNYDYAVCLDTSYGPADILGLKLLGKTRFGIGTIDHHTRSDRPAFPAQDYTRPQVSSTCELVFDLIEDYFGGFDSFPTKLRKSILINLLKGMIDDMVGLMVPEKVTAHNLVILEKLHDALGKAAFRQHLSASRTLQLPNHVNDYSKYLRHFVLHDKNSKKFHAYLLDIPKEAARLFSRVYVQSLMLFEHYARTICLKSGRHYGFFLMSIREFDEGITKISVRGPLVKQLFRERLKTDHPFFSYGISGNSAFGGKVPSKGNAYVGSRLIRELKETARTLALTSKYESTAYIKRLERLQKLVEDMPLIDG